MADTTDTPDVAVPAPLVHGTTIVEGTAIYTDGNYSVYIGRIFGPDKPDMDHYLIVNDQHRTIEASSNRLVEARAAAWGLSKAEFDQDVRIHNAQPLIEDDRAQAQGNGKNKSWPKQH